MVIDNFFDDFHNIEHHFKTIKLHTLAQYRKQFDKNSNWPGRRSDYLHRVEPFLYNLYNKEFKKFELKGRYKVDSFVHLRESKKDDWPHRDNQYGG